jgi:cupin fold WbuC family metalloprotein
MIIDDKLLDELLDQVKRNPRLRQNFDLRTISSEDTSQRMLNALLPGTQVTIHRYRGTIETVVLLRGSIEEIFFDNNGVECARYEVSRGLGSFALQVSKGQWHTVVVKVPSVILEAKNGAFKQLTSSDIWSFNFF